MDNAAYPALSRISGLRKEMDVIANNLANMSTTGFRREGVVFAEHVKAAPDDAGSISMSEARVRRTDMAAGAMERTGGALDLAIDGDGFFMVAGPEGQRLTRAGAFHLNAEGGVVDAGGRALLDENGAQIFVPQGVAEIRVDPDGAVLADGQIQARIAMVTVERVDELVREDGVLFRTDAPLVPGAATVSQGFVESANVSAIEEMARMIEVQRGYELGQSMLERDDERIRSVVRTLGSSAG